MTIDKRDFTVENDDDWEVEDRNEGEGGENSRENEDPYDEDDRWFEFVSKACTMLDKLKKIASRNNHQILERSTYSSFINFLQSYQ